MDDEVPLLTQEEIAHFKREGETERERAQRERERDRERENWSLKLPLAFLGRVQGT